MVETTTLILIIFISAGIIGLTFFLLWWFVWRPKDTSDTPRDDNPDDNPDPNDNPDPRPVGTSPCIISTINGNVTVPSPWYQDPNNPRRCLAPPEQGYCEPTILEDGTPVCAATFSVENFPNTNSINNWISINVTRTPIQFNSDLIQGCYRDSNSTDPTIYFVNGRGKTCIMGSTSNSSSSFYSRFCNAYNTPVPANLIKGSTPNNVIPVCGRQDGNINQEVTFTMTESSTKRALTVIDNFILDYPVTADPITNIGCDGYTWSYTGPNGMLKLNNTFNGHMSSDVSSRDLIRRERISLDSNVNITGEGNTRFVRYTEGPNKNFVFIPLAPDYNSGKICETYNINNCIKIKPEFLQRPGLTSGGAVSVAVLAALSVIFPFIALSIPAAIAAGAIQGSINQQPIDTNVIISEFASISETEFTLFTLGKGAEAVENLGCVPN
jgi:hypothetical protein